MGQEVETLTMLKRDNWTNDEVIEILKGMRMQEPNVRGGKAKDIVNAAVYNNIAIDEAIDTFEDFKRDPNIAGEYSAKAFQTDSGEIVHIGTMPPR